ncbi:MAG: galactitol-1-phosphate 5-dehydrogenase [Oscillospiraceae bacterium]|nr:galactitol-1-phosphate 5-dehydrogenase [Oscillospiraceae bacterium]
MKAAVLYAPGDLRVERREVPRIKSAQDVLIRVKAVGICGSDLDRVLHTGTYSFPTIPGHEFCGIVEELGEDAVGFQVGDRVVVAPILPCMKCDSCSKGHYGQCDDYDYLGSRRDGAMAEYVIAPVQNLIKMPDNMSFAEGAAVEPAAVTLHGMIQVGIEVGDSVVVLGCGPLGVFAVSFAKLMGASEVYVVDIDPQKFAAAASAGADGCVNALETDAVEALQQITKNKGFNVVIETAGSSITQEQSLRLAKKKGRVLYLGTAHNDVVLPPTTFEKIVRNELWVTGSWNSFSAPFPGREWYAILKYVSDGRFDLSSAITHKISLDQLPEVLVQMDKKEFVYSKVMIEIE